MLAGLPKAPSAYNPVVNRERAVVRQRYILSRLLALGWIDQDAHDQAQAEPLVLRSPERLGGLHVGHAVEQARQRVVERFGDAAYTRGLDVVLSIDADLQREAMRALRGGLLRAQQQRGYAGPEARLRRPGDSTGRGCGARWPRTPTAASCRRPWCARCRPRGCRPTCATAAPSRWCTAPGGARASRSVR